MNRFHIFLIDTGWNGRLEAVREQASHLPLLYKSDQDSLYLLTPEQSVEILKLDPAAIGHDPTILVYDLYARPGPGDGPIADFT